VWTLYAEAVSETIGIVEVRGDLRGIVDLAIRQPTALEIGDVSLGEAAGVEGQSLRETTERLHAPRHVLGGRRAGHPVRQIRVWLLGTEQLRVLGQSIRRAVHRADGNGDRSPFGDRQRRRDVEQGVIQPGVSIMNRHVNRLHGHER
jgi:hypothetical protein